MPRFAALVRALVPYESRRALQLGEMLSLHLVLMSLVYINTLMIQQLLTESAWHSRLNANDLRGIAPLDLQPRQSLR